MKRKDLAFNVAYCGITCAFALAVMFSAVIPALVYLSAATAGIVVWTVYSQTSMKWGLLTYAAVAILSLFLIPEVEGKTYFIALFGYYPLIRELLTRIKVRPLRLAAKLAIFNIAAVGSFMIVVHIFGIADALDGLEWAGANAVYVFWAVGNAAFLLYDFTLTTIFRGFDILIKPALNRRIKPK